MVKPHKKLTREEKLAKDRLRKRQKYAQIKNDPELYALHKEKERTRYLTRKEKKKICSIKDMTPRAQREQRKRWRKNSQSYLKRKKEQERIEGILIENTPPVSDEDNCAIQGPDPLMLAEPGPSNQNIPHRPQKSISLLRRMRYSHLKIVKKLKNKIKKLQKQKDVLRKRTKNRRIAEDSIEKKVTEVLTAVSPDKKKAVKKQLLFSETITRNLKTSYESLNKKDKRNFAESVIKDKEKLRKYKLLHKLPFHQRKKKITEKSIQTLINQIHSFFEEDTNSRVAAGKREFIKKGSVKKQKRYLNDNLKNLHAKFLKEECIVSYSTFCKYRPYWVVFPKIDRDTCQCKLHSNVNLLVKALKKAKIILESTGTEVLNSLCCNTSQKCLQRRCQTCANRVLNYQEFLNDKKLVYYQWIVEKKPYTLKDGIQKTKIVTVKKRFEDYPRHIIHKLESSFNSFFKHSLNIVEQYTVIKQLKQNLDDSEILLHVDFSENYYLKYNQEIQSFHFGGSREQVSLHTGVLYYKDSETGTHITKSFCTMSSCLKHDAGSIWAHLSPVLKMAQQLVQYKIVHFLSDSPSSQYRNRNIFYMITKLKEINSNITKVTWNYQESGHGKGAPDGIGAVVKRTADNYVKYGGDVGSFEDFTALVTEKINNVHFEIIKESNIAEKKFPHNIPGFKGTMHVHQVIWTDNSNKTVTLRSLSCFECQDVCKHKKHLGFLYCNNYGEAVDDQCSSRYDQNEASYINEDRSILNIDTPTIFNNIGDPKALENLKLLEDNISLPPSPVETLSAVNKPIAPLSPKIKILSDVRVCWENREFYKVPEKKLVVSFNSDHQREFETFIHTYDKENQNGYQESDEDPEELNIF